MVQKPSGLLSVISDGQHTSLGISRQILTTRRCYCILSRLPFFDLHFGVLHRFVSLPIEFLYCQIFWWWLKFDGPNLGNLVEQKPLGVQLPGCFYCVVKLGDLFIDSVYLKKIPTPTPPLQYRQDQCVY